MAIQIRRGTNSSWESNKSNIVAGEPVVTTDTGRIIVGTGSGTFTEAALKSAIAYQSGEVVNMGNMRLATSTNGTRTVLYMYVPLRKEITTTPTVSISAGFFETDAGILANFGSTNPITSVSATVCDSGLHLTCNLTNAISGSTYIAGVSIISTGTITF